MADPPMPQPYDARFYQEQTRGSLSSAGEVVPIVLGLIRPRSVVDVGCGVGTWLSVFQRHGIADIAGMDGGYVPRGALQIPEGHFIAADLCEAVRLHRRFDLAVSLEVAEHLPPARAEGFVHDLTELAPAVLFSAAIPGQGGTGHVNEQWQDHWADLFERRGYRAVDAIRWRIWENEKVEYWYRQNLLIYVDGAQLSRYPRLLEPVPVHLMPRRLAHPATIMQIVGEKDSLKGTLLRLPSIAAAAIRRRVGGS